jgi:uroporphyrinogen decarboxylase
MSLLIDAAYGKELDRPPIWIMRQAGRYMKEYREIRDKYDFLKMCKNPDVATEISLLPIKLLDVDAAIMFSDILVTAEAMGGKLSYVEGTGPLFSNPVKTKADIESLSITEVPEKLDYVAQLIKQLKNELKADKPLIGFAGAPFTVMSYLIEGGSSKDLKKTKQFLYRQPELSHLLLEKITSVTIDYLNMQIEAGIDALQIFDSWAMYLSHYSFVEFSLPYIAKVIDSLNKPKNVPVITFARGSSSFYKQMRELNTDVISVDWNANLADVQRDLGNDIVVQGNMDPYVLYADKRTIQNEAIRILKSMDEFPSFIFNLGHGVTPDLDIDNVKCLVDTVKSYQKV